MDKILVLLSILFAFSCKAQQSKLQEKKNWMWSFKSIAIYSCICELTNDGIVKELSKHNDISFMAETEILESYFSKNADSLGRDYGTKIKPIFSNDSEFAGRKAIFTSCLSLYDNADFNTVVRTKYRKYKKQNP